MGFSGSGGQQQELPGAAAQGRASEATVLACVFSNVSTKTILWLLLIPLRKA